MKSRTWRVLIEDFKMLACLYAARFIVWRELRRRRREGVLARRPEKLDKLEVFE